MKLWAGVSVVCGVMLIVGALVIAETKGENLFDQIRDLVTVETIHQEKVFDAGTFRKVSVRTSNGAVEVRRAADGDYHITVGYGEPRDERWRYDVREEGGTLVIEKRDNGWQLFQLFSNIEPIVIEVPEGVVLDFDIKTSNGSLSMSGVSVRDARLETSNGRVEAEDVSEFCPNIMFLEEGIMECDTSLEVKTSNGKITLNGISVDEIVGRTSNGGIEFGGLKMQSLDLKTSNGGISGDVVGGRSEFTIQADTSNGSIKVDDGSYGKHLSEGNGVRNITLKTSNGGIQLNFAK